MPTWTIEPDKLAGQFLYNPGEPLIFSSGLFLFLFAAFILGFYLVHRHQRTKLVYLILFSLFFYYKSSGWYLVLLLITTMADFGLAHAMWNARRQVWRNILLVISLAFNLGLLGYFKYTNFLFEIYYDALGQPIRHFDIFLPVGVSFFTFQSLSYTLDVYRRELEPTPSILDYAFFISFFPQLVAGPIVRARDFLPQIRQPVMVTREMFGRGVYLFAAGLFKKAVISDYISINFVDRIFDNPGLYTGFENLLGIYGYALQIYCDFSGYSDMAIGIALLLGYRLLDNFDSPYQSASITEFWRRWHISLSGWLRDYLYIPLGGNRRLTTGTILFPVLFAFLAAWLSYRFLGTWLVPGIILGLLAITLLVLLIFPKTRLGLGTYLNLLNTMLLGGLWHGASFRFILWGFLHGMALMFEKARMKLLPVPRNPFFRIAGMMLTFHFVCFTWIFFRADSMEVAGQMLSQITTAFHPEIMAQFFHSNEVILGFMAIGFALHFIPTPREKQFEAWLGRRNLAVQVIWIMLVVMLVFQVKSSQIQPFIYFQF